MSRGSRLRSMNLILQMIWILVLLHPFQKRIQHPTCPPMILQKIKKMPSLPSKALCKFLMYGPYLEASWELQSFVWGTKILNGWFMEYSTFFMVGFICKSCTVNVVWLCISCYCLQSISKLMASLSKSFAPDFLRLCICFGKSPCYRCTCSSSGNFCWIKAWAACGLWSTDIWL